MDRRNLQTRGVSFQPAASCRPLGCPARRLAPFIPRGPTDNLSKPSQSLRLLQGMNDQKDKGTSEADRETQQKDRYPSQAEGDLETVEEDLKEKGQDPGKATRKP